MLDVGHGLQSMAFRVDCELLGRCLRDPAHRAAEQVGYEVMPGAPFASQLAPPHSRFLPRNNPFIKYWSHEVAIELAPPRQGQASIEPVGPKRASLD